MNKDKQYELLNQITNLRKRMIKTGLKKGLENNETIKLSKELDQLIFKYQLNNLIK
jgi:hypothetical protein